MFVAMLKDASKEEALWACAQVYHVCKAAEAATAMTRRFLAQGVPLAIHKHPNAGINFFTHTIN